MVATSTALPGPAVSVIIPARNEEGRVGECLQSLIAQTGVDFEIIAVDDHSIDRTREIALPFADADPRRVCVIDSPTLPPHWTGKNNALVAGVEAARGRWLLFTDADTVHLPGSLARSLEEARSHNVEMLSYSPEQIVETFSEKAVMPVIFAELATRYRPSEISDPNSSAAAANGQYILITRQAYDAVGGHAGIAGEILEDVALARAVKRSGRKIYFRYGADAVRTRMYCSFAQLREGWTKNLALLFPSPASLALLRLAEFCLITASLAVTLFEFVRGNWVGALVTTALTAFTWRLFLIRVRRAHFRPSANSLAIFGLPLFGYLLLRSRNFHRRGIVQWKGRTYSGSVTHNSISVPDSSAAESKGSLATDR